VTIPNFKNQEAILRESTEDVITNLLSLFGFHNCDVSVEGLPENEKNNKRLFFIINNTNLHAIEMPSMSKPSEADKLPYANFSILAKLQALTLHWLSTCAHIPSPLVKIGPEMAVTIKQVYKFPHEVIARQEYEAIVVVKPTGMYGKNFKLIVDAIKASESSVHDAFYTTNMDRDYFEGLYKDVIINRPFGPKWFYYMTSSPILVLRISTSSIDNLRLLMLTARDSSGLPYAENIAHTSDSIKEGESNTNLFFIKLPISEQVEIKNQDGYDQAGVCPDVCL